MVSSNHVPITLRMVTARRPPLAPRQPAYVPRVQDLSEDWDDWISIDEEGNHTPHMMVDMVSEWLGETEVLRTPTPSWDGESGYASDIEYTSFYGSQAARPSSICLAWEGLSNISEVDPGVEADISGLTMDDGDTSMDTFNPDISDITLTAPSCTGSDSGNLSSCDTSRDSIETVQVCTASRAPVTPGSVKFAASTPRKEHATANVTFGTPTPKQNIENQSPCASSPARSIFSQMRFTSARSLRSLSSLTSRRRARTPATRSPDKRQPRTRPPLPSFFESGNFVPKNGPKHKRTRSRLVARDKLKARAEAHAEAEEKEKALMEELERVGALRPRRMAKLRSRGLMV